jgi:hypothetical protein
MGKLRQSANLVKLLINFAVNSKWIKSHKIRSQLVFCCYRLTQQTIIRVKTKRILLLLSGWFMMRRGILLGTLIGFLIITVFALLLPNHIGSVIGWLVGGIVAGALATGVGRGTLAGLLAGVLGLIMVTVLAAVGYLLVGGTIAGILHDLFENALNGQPAYIVAMAASSIGIVVSVVGGFIGGFFSQLFVE